MEAEEPKSSGASSRRGARRTTASRPPARRAPSRAENEDTDIARPGLDRAEEVLDRLGKRIGQWMNEATMQATAAFARAREEAEDILAEARHVRQGRQDRESREDRQRKWP